jgi:hypothetical protein
MARNYRFDGTKINPRARNATQTKIVIVPPEG